MILIVDDEPSALVLLEMILRRDGHVVRNASSGADALRLLEEEKDEPCDLVISDLRMPGMDGRELVAHLRAHARLARTPVVMCTSTTDRATVLDLIEQGVKGYIVKPVKSSVVLAKVRGVLAGEEPVIEPRDQTVRRLEIDLVEYAPLANATVPLLDKVTGDLNSALQTRDSYGARMAAERVKETAALFGARRARTAADCVLMGRADREVLHFAAILITEIGELRSALERVGLAGRA